MRRKRGAWRSFGAGAPLAPPGPGRAARFWVASGPPARAPPLVLGARIAARRFRPPRWRALGSDRGARLCACVEWDYGRSAFARDAMSVSAKRRARPEVALFDLDDTLYHAPEMKAMVADKIKQYMIDYLHVDPTQAERECFLYYTRFGTTLAGLAASGYEIDYDHWHDAVHHSLPYSTFLKKDPALRAMLQSLSVPKIVFTNADAKHAEICLELLGVRDLFAGVIAFESTQAAAKREGLHPVGKGVVCKPSKVAYDVALIETRRILLEEGMTTIVERAHSAPLLDLGADDADEDADDDAWGEEVRPADQPAKSAPQGLKMDRADGKEESKRAATPEAANGEEADAASTSPAAAADAAASTSPAAAADAAASISPAAAADAAASTSPAADADAAASTSPAAAADAAASTSPAAAADAAASTSPAVAADAAASTSPAAAAAAPTSPHPPPAPHGELSFVSSFALPLPELSVWRPPTTALDPVLPPLDPSQVLWLDDSTRNVAAGHNLGMLSVLVGRTDAECNADYQIARVTDLPKVVPDLFAEGKTSTPRRRLEGQRDVADARPKSAGSEGERDDDNDGEGNDAVPNGAADVQTRNGDSNGDVPNGADDAQVQNDAVVTAPTAKKRETNTEDATPQNDTTDAEET